MAVSAGLGACRSVELAAGPIEYRERGTGRPIVFVHGVGVNGDLWRHVVPGLADGFRCIAPDLPWGAHRHPISPRADLSLGGMARIVADLLAALELEDVTLVGNDTGGGGGQGPARPPPPRLRRAVVPPLAPVARLPPPRATPPPPCS